MERSISCALSGSAFGRSSSPSGVSEVSQKCLRRVSELSLLSAVNMHWKPSLCLASLLVIACLRTTDSYIVVEPERSDQILINSLIDNKQLESNALSVDSGPPSDKLSENQTSNTSQTVSSLWLRESPVSAKRSQRTKSCNSCAKEKESVSPRDEYIQRLEYIKHQILSKLGLSEAPKLLQKNFDSYNCK